MTQSLLEHEDKSVPCHTG